MICLLFLAPDFLAAFLLAFGFLEADFFAFGAFATLAGDGAETATGATFAGDGAFFGALFAAFGLTVLLAGFDLLDALLDYE